MKRNSKTGLMMLAATLFAAASCTDFSDYNDVPQSSLPSADQTLWENISQHPQLTEFAALVYRTGFSRELSSSRAYTVWAPLDGQIDPAIKNLSDSLLLAQFVKNHVAEFSYLATGDRTEDNTDLIHMLNGKSYGFLGNGSYTFDKVPLAEANKPSVNGILHTISGVAPFYPNIYEYIMQAKDQGIDSLNHYFARYETSRLDLENSEKGPMVDGLQTYLDSVIITSNSLTEWLAARLAVEDSSYSILLPTDKAYMDLYNKVKSRLNFIASTKYQNVSALESEGAASQAGDNTRNGKSATEDLTTTAAYRQDSLVRREIVRNLVFSNNDTYNQFLRQRLAVRTGEPRDSVRSTKRDLLSNPGELFEDYLSGEPVEMSNGWGYPVDSVALLPWESYTPEIVVSPARNLAKYFTAIPRAIHVIDTLTAEQLLGPGYTEFRYACIEPSGERAKPGIFLTLPNVESTTYKFYCVVLPPRLGIDTITRPTPMNFDLSYCLANGNLSNYRFSSKFIKTGTGENPTTLDLNNTAFKSEKLNDIDTLYLGQFTFPVSYRGLTNAAPSLYISSPVSLFNNTQMAANSREFRIYAIILRPVEKEEYEANNQ